MKDSKTVEHEKQTPSLIGRRRTGAIENNVEQRKLGGITGRGFVPGRSGNPGGRPKSHGLLEALRAAIDVVAHDGKTVEERLVTVLLEEALKRLPPLSRLRGQEAAGNSFRELLTIRSEPAPRVSNSSVHALLDGYSNCV